MMMLILLSLVQTDSPCIMFLLWNYKVFVPRDKGKHHYHYWSPCRLAIQNHPAAPAELFSPGRLILISIFIEIMISWYIFWSRSSQGVVKVKNQARPLAQILYKERLGAGTMLTSHHHRHQRSQQHRYHHNYHQYWLYHSHPNHTKSHQKRVIIFIFRAFRETELAAAQ